MSRKQKNRKSKIRGPTPLATGPKTRSEAPLPPGAREVDLPGRDTRLPPIFEIPNHDLVPDQHGTIYLVVVDYAAPTMTQLFETVAKMETPVNGDDARANGFAFLKPSNNDFLVMRDRYGDGKEGQDRVVSWSMCKTDHDDAHISKLEDLRDRMLGPEELITKDKAVYNEKTKTYEGGITIERSDRAINVPQGPRCYQAGITFQGPKSLAAPGRQAKVVSVQPDEDAILRKDLVTIGAQTAMSGLKAKAPPALLSTLMQQAETTNLPRVGVDENTAYPAMQLNIASGMKQDRTGRKSLSGTMFKAEMGKFAIAHLDGSDSPAVPTAMSILSKPHSDIETEYFYLLDCGIAWEMEELATLYFSGLYFHGGSQPTYRKGRRMEPNTIFYRMTLIAYPQGCILDGNNAVAFAALPKNKPLFIGLEMRNSMSHQISERASTTQATFVSDGTAIMDHKSYLNYFARNIAELVAYLTHQAPPELLLRFDRNTLISSFSSVIDNKRVRSDQWDHGPGWSDEDVKIGKDYADILSALGVSKIEELPAYNLALLYNSDSQTQAPYGNRNIQVASSHWAVHTAKCSKNIPVCIVADGLSDAAILGGRGSKAAGRKAAVSRARSGAKKKKTINPKAKTVLARKLRAFKDKVPAQEQQHMDVDNESIESRNKDSDLFPDEDSMDMDNDADELLGVSINTGPIPTAPVEAAPTFLSTIHLRKLQAFCSSYQDMPADIVDQENIQDFRDILQALDGFDYSRLNCFWRALQIRSHWHAGSGIDLCIRQQELLVLNMVVWEWLDHHLEAAYIDLSSSSLQLAGITLLLKHVQKLLDTQSSRVVFDASEYFTAFNPGEVTYEYTAIRKRYDIPDKNQIFSLASTILICWFGFPLQTQFQTQSWFIRAIVDHVGLEALLLDSVWKAAHSINAAVLKIGRSRRVSRRDIEEWATTILAYHPLAMRGSQERLLLEEIDRSIRNQFAINPGLLSLSNMFRLTRASLPDTSMIPPSAPNLPNPSAFNEFYRKLELLFPFLDDPAIHIDIPKKGRTAAELNAYWTASYRSNVEKHTDKKLPFRDLAVSRRRILEDGGPFSPENLSTRAGFFSALVYRGITHHTSFLLDHQTLFRDLEDWTTIYDSLKEDRLPTYFCDKCAYGQATDRSVENAAYYWDASGNSNLTHWLYSDELISFVDLFILIRDAGPSLLPSFGDLTSYLLAVDYASAGKAILPTVEEMGEVIFFMKKGALSGLRELGFQCTNAAETSASFLIVFNELQQSISPFRQGQMDFGFFFLEHLLCKAKRLDIEAFRNIKDVT